MTTYNFAENPESIGNYSPAEIKKIELKSSDIINCKDKIIRFEKRADSVNYIVITTIT